MPSPSTPADWARLADQVQTRMRELGLTVEKVHKRGGLSEDSVSFILNARRQSYRDRTLADLEVGLDWAPGSVRAVLTGGEPVAADRATARPVTTAVVDRGVGRLVTIELASGKVIQAWSTDEITPAEVAEVRSHFESHRAS